MENNSYIYKEVLLNIFQDSTVTVFQIDQAIKTVLSDYGGTESLFDNNLEVMIDLLLVQSGDVKRRTDSLWDDCTVDSDLEGAIGFVDVLKGTLSEREFNSVRNVFPDICPQFLTTFFKEHSDLGFDEVVNELSQMDYVKREMDPLDLWNDLKQMLPNADPTYLRNQAHILARKPECYEKFLQDALEKPDYPTLQEYLKRKQQVEDVAVYTEKFTVKKYLQVVPNPLELFMNPERKAVLGSGTADAKDEEYVFHFLYNQFPYLRQNDIKKVFLSQNKHLIKTHNKLKIFPRAFRHPREQIKQKENECFNVNLLQEIAFLKHEKSIRTFLKMQNDKYREALEEAKKFGLLRTCLCCFDDQLIPEECLFCNNNCTFCKNCVKLGAEHVIGEGRTRFPCLADCKSEFNYGVLKMVLDRKVFQRLCQKKQIEEIKSANIDGLETCPFCEFSMVPAEGDKIFKCENIECMKESCRECHHISHIPLKCSEIEYDEDVKMRTFIENKMTEALLRTCWKCSRQFYKESGCNKMTCLCGAEMCYLCGKAVNDYRHFTNLGCPLFTENLEQLHLNNILKGAEKAKNELGVDKNPTKLKFDPTKGLRRN